MSILTAVFAAVFGAVTGSFLNACIHRMPRGISLLEPRRSFCPACGKTIPWFENLPLVSWLALRGKCSGCGSPISICYPLVEILTAALFAALWLRFGFPMGVAYFSFAALMVAASFIDLEHFIIPDEITIGGTVLGVLLCAAVPELMETSSRLAAVGFSLLGAAAGFALIFLVVELGKLAFGRIRHRFDPSEEFEWKREGEEAALRIGDDSLAWQDIFSREKDRMVIVLEGEVGIDGESVSAAKLFFFHNRVMAGSRSWDLETLQSVRGRMSSVVIPREAMGFGDVKFMACIGAFLGWQAVLFTLFAASIVGSIVGIAGLFLARDRAGVRIPFGPFLAIGALLCLFVGRDLVDWWFDAVRGLRPDFF
jgi:leader peptidase (prepilin peptidase)/N-methyltransferase